MLAGLGTVVAAWLVWYGATTHLQRSCVLLDTPYLPLCPQALPDSDPRRSQQLRERLRANPGDSGAWVDLASLASDESQAELLHAVAVLAPSDPNSLRLRARQALAAHQMELATDLLVKMTEYHLGGEEPPQMLARLLSGSEGMALLRPHLTAGSHWVPKCTLRRTMANPEQVSPLSAQRGGVLTSFPAQFKDTLQDGISTHSGATPQATFTAITLKISIGSNTQTYVSGVDYIASRRELRSLLGRDISSCMRFVPIRDDPEMVVNLGLPVAEAGLRRLGVAA